jgi:hypothetical protein
MADACNFRLMELGSRSQKAERKEEQNQNTRDVPAAAVMHT